MAAPLSKKSKTSRARIKKIMQLDEEVGKLASGTPVMISKSIECFMQTLLAEAATEAQKRGGRKLTAYHLKQTINSNETFDFLREIVSTIPDPTEPEPSSTTNPTSGTKRKPRSNAKQSLAQGQEEADIPDVKPGTSMPEVGTWSKEGGTGEGGRGMFDDYEDDEEDY